MSTGTQVEVVMPQMGVSVSEGTITRWLKQPGEQVARDEPLLEISTDKVDTEVPSPGEGVVSEVRVQEGETVEVGTVLAVIAPAGTLPADVESASEEPPAAQAAQPEPSEHVAEVAEEALTQQVPAPPDAAPQPEPASAGNGKSFISPVVARIAA
jgi:2-oxoglutarate dehydrogenase E2 component (dihydrolipoamide succinyltransferase)